MVSLFSFIDNWLINHLQWAVRQLELYTPVTRKDVSNYTLFAMKCLLIIMSLLVVTKVLLIKSVDVSVFFGFLNVLFCRSFYFDSKILNKIKDKEGVLPQEIITRKGRRFPLVFFSPVIFLLMVISLFYLLYLDLSLVGQLDGCLSLVLMLTFLFLFFFEYLLCTTSLPPGEKDKKKAEKEMESAVPQSM